MKLCGTFWVPVVLLAAAVPGLAQTAARKRALPQAMLQSNTIEKTLIQQEKQAWGEERNRNAEYLQTLMAEEFVAIEPDGKRYTKAGALALIRSIAMTDYALDDFRVVRVNPDAAILTYRARMKWLDRGEENAGQVLATTVWVHRDGKWLMTFHQRTAVP